MMHKSMKQSSTMKIESLPMNVFSEICALADKHNLTGIMLFGSRARDDYRRTSDIDLAIRGGNTDAFALDVEEETSTLLRFDCVDLDRPVNANLLDSIYKEGVVIYEKD